jgi:exodeoxyribonuclease VII small subunit
MVDKKDIKNMSFEAALKELEDVVKQLERTDLELELAIETYQYGEELKSFCDKKLAAAKLKIDKITGANPDGITQTEAFTSQA